MENYNRMEGGELQEGMSLSASDLGDYDKGYTLLPEGDYDFTVVNIESTRYTPGPNSSGKIGPCKQIVLTMRVLNPEDGEPAEEQGQAHGHIPVLLFHPDIVLFRKTHTGQPEDPVHSVCSSGSGCRHG